MADANRHALVVAISDYQDEQLRRLAAPVNDAKAFAKALADPSIGNFTIGPAVINKSASDVLETMEGWLRERLPTDLVVVYFSGHGLKDDGGNLYLAARNTTTNRLLSTGIADSVLRALLSACRAKQQVLILDCCFGNLGSGVLPAN